MEKINLSDNDLKTLKLFTYYIKSHGESEVRLSLFIDSECYIDEFFHSWYGDKGNTVDSYDTVNELMSNILNQIDPCQYFESEDSNGEIRLVIDCDLKLLEVRLYENVRTTNESTSIRHISEDSGDYIFTFFKEMNELGFLSGEVTFDGSGDEGYIDGIIYFNTGESKKISDGIEDYLYEFLGKYYPGWEINEGSTGNFYFEFTNDTIILNFGDHVESYEDRGRVCQIDF